MDTLLFVDDQFTLAEDEEDASYIVCKLIDELGVKGWKQAFYSYRMSSKSLECEREDMQHNINIWR